MRYALFIALMLAVGCGDELAGDDIPPKPSCDRDDVMALMTVCPDDHEWIASWRRPDPMGSTQMHLPLGEDPGEPWTFEGQDCVEGGDISRAKASPGAWRCQGDTCTSYRYQVEDGDAVETNSVRCVADNDSVSLVRVTVRPSEEPVTRHYLWAFGGPGEDVTEALGD